MVSLPTEEEGGGGREVGPTVRGYCCVATPTPGAEASLLMTWDDIKSTLLALGTLLHGVGAGDASFRISEMSRRDKTAHALERSGRRRSSCKAAGARRRRPRKGGGNAAVGLALAAVLRCCR